MSSEIITTDVSALAAGTSCIDVSEVETQADKDLLLKNGKAIRDILVSAVLDIGEKVAEIQDQLEGRHTGGLKKFYKSCGINTKVAERCACSYRVFVVQVLEHDADEEMIGVLNGMNPFIAQKIINLPKAEQTLMHERIAEGDLPSKEEVTELANKPEVRLSKAQEMLARARAKKEESVAAVDAIKADPDQSCTKDNPDYVAARNSRYHADQSIANFEQQIADLEAAIEEEKLKTAEQAEATANAEAEKAAIEKELQKLKFDDAKVRAERVKKLSTTLTVSLPQALADVSKFFAEIDQYPEEVRDHIYNSAKDLANQIADKL